eukprot:13006419-Ditylum_brightwellii.AAC.1
MKWQEEGRNRGEMIEEGFITQEEGMGKRNASKTKGREGKQSKIDTSVMVISNKESQKKLVKELMKEHGEVVMETETGYQTAATIEW